VGERSRLVEDIRDDDAARLEAVPLSEAEREELDRRLEADGQNPGDATPWDDLKRRAREHARRARSFANESVSIVL
jgi:putative addiction module component (TIGR02574 family)